MYRRIVNSKLSALQFSRMKLDCTLRLIAEKSVADPGFNMLWWGWNGEQKYKKYKYRLQNWLRTV